MFVHPLFGQQTNQEKERNSLAYKQRRFYMPLFSIYVPDYSYRFQEAFYLVQKANSGDALAQHELGIRYIVGEGFPKDTVKSCYWIRRAAEQGLPVACYNLAIFLNNGWGTVWNPFEAFKYFQIGAINGMPDAEFVLGVLFTENLVVPKNLDSAYYWINKSAGKGFASAIDALKKLPAKGSGADTVNTRTVAQGKTKQSKPSAAKATSLTALNFDFINFNADSTVVPSDSLIFYELMSSSNNDIKENIGFTSFDSLKTKSIDSLIRMITESANSGSPEANTFLGRFYEKGTFYKKDLVKAGLYYLRAFRLESSIAGYFLSKLMTTKEFENELQKRVAAKDADAYFVFATLNSIGYSSSMTAFELINYLQLAAQKNHIGALIELGQCYFLGRPIERDTAKAFMCWNTAAALGSDEAILRNVMAHLLLNRERPGTVTIEFLQSEESKGSILAQLILAYMYEAGIGVPTDTQESVQLYRKAAYRGSRTAYSSLKRVYDEMRPADPAFTIIEPK